MYELINSILSDKKGGITFTCFGIWHILYMAVIFGAIVLAILLLRRKSDKAKQRAISVTLGCAFGLYIADFFIMPLAYGETDIERLPFHVCTAMCVMSFISRHNSFLGSFRTQFALLGFVSNLIYFIYPAGIMWYQIHPLSYRVVHTLLFHGSMTAFGAFSLVFGDIVPQWKKLHKELIVIVAMTLWALLGNTLYNNTRCINWFFVVRDPFYLLPENISPYIMPFIMIIVMLTAVTLTYLLYFGIRKLFTRSK